MAEDTLYDTDIVAWAEQQVAELRRLAKAAPSNVVDWDNLIEEVESVGRSQVSGVKRKLVLVISHLIKVISAPDLPPSRGWRAEIGSFQRVLKEQFSPSMQRVIDWEATWRDSIEEAQSSLSLWGDELIRGLPAENPFKLDDIVGPDFELQAALQILADSIRPS
jgi:hypothetical protein